MSHPSSKPCHWKHIQNPLISQAMAPVVLLASSLFSLCAWIHAGHLAVPQICLPHSRSIGKNYDPRLRILCLLVLLSGMLSLIYSQGFFPLFQPVLRSIIICSEKLTTATLWKIVPLFHHFLDPYLAFLMGLIHTLKCYCLSCFRIKPVK